MLWGAGREGQIIGEEGLEFGDDEAGVAVDVAADREEGNAPVRDA